MADEITNQMMQQAASTTQDIGNVILTNLKHSFDLVQRISGEKGAAIGLEFSEKVLSYVNKLQQELTTKEFNLADSFKFDGAKLQGEISRGIQDLKSFMKSSGFTDMAIALGVSFDETAVNSAFGTITEGILNSQTVAEVGIYSMIQGLSNGITSTLSPLKNVEDQVMSINRQGLNLFGDRLNLSNLVEAGNTVQGISTIYRQQALEAVKLGYSLDQVRTNFDTLSRSANISLGQIQSLGAASIDTGNALEGLAGFQQIVEATGMDASKGGKLLELQMRSLGVQANEALSAFDTLTKVQRNTHLSIDEVADVVTTGADRFKMYGNNIQGVATLYKQLLDGLGTGKEAIAKSVFEGVAGGIAGMSTEMKAFIGLTTQLGGGGGALESALRIEEAMSSGEGLNEILDSIYSRVEEMSGTQILTRQEALQTGQTQQYFVQRQLLGQMTGLRGEQLEQTIEQLMQARRGGQAITRDMLQPTAGFAESVAGRAEDTLTQKLGVMGRLSNQLEGTAALTSTEGLSQSLSSIAQGFIPVGKNMVESMQKLSEQFHLAAKTGTMENLFNKVAASKVGLEVQAGAASGHELGAGGPGIGAYANVGALARAGITQTEAFADQATLEAKTGTKSIDQLNNAVALSAKAEMQSIESYKTIIELQNKGIQSLEVLINKATAAANVISPEKQREAIGHGRGTISLNRQEIIPPTDIAAPAVMTVTEQQKAELAKTPGAGAKGPIKIPVVLEISADGTIKPQIVQTTIDSARHSIGE